MTDWDEIMADLAALGEAVSATYKPAAGGSIACTVLIDEVVGGLEAAGDDEHEMRQQTVTLLRSEVADPARGDTITIDGQEWAVQRIAGQSQATTSIIVSRQHRRRLAGNERVATP